ncbi:NAD-dependent epimerase/dehydratase family protein [Candidatus Pelagibacter bacterium nBUS_49]|uniref:NmrA family NAD(P)-binding protein n=1 Tax=Candidatus Pelagibacter bacterium nBUS_49 TaxID=3374196 RepID=UPI003EBA171B
MKAKNCLIFGGSGQIGRNLIRKLTKNNYRVTVVTRNIHQKSYIIKTQANAGYIDVVEANIFDEDKIRNLFKKADICINLIGILFEKKETILLKIFTQFCLHCYQNFAKNIILSILFIYQL